MGQLKPKKKTTGKFKTPIRMSQLKIHHALVGSL